MSQVKEQDKIPEEALIAVVMDNLPKKKFKVIVKMIKELRRKMEKQSEKLKLFNRDEEYTN